MLRYFWVYTIIHLWSPMFLPHIMHATKMHYMQLEQNVLLNQRQKYWKHIFSSKTLYPHWKNLARKCNRNIGKYSEIYGPISPPLLLDRKSSKKYWKIFLNLRPHFPASATRLVVHHSGAPARLCTRSKTYKARLCTTSKTVQKQPEQIIVSHCSAPNWPWCSKCNHNNK